MRSLTTQIPSCALCQLLYRRHSLLFVPSNSHQAPVPQGWGSPFSITASISDILPGRVPWSDAGCDPVPFERSCYLLGSPTSPCCR